MKISAILPAVVLLSAGCRSSGDTPQADDPYPSIPQVERVEPGVRGQGSVAALPRAVIYRTNGDYNDCVAVTLDASRSGLASYPAPGDVNASSAPLVMADGWLLDRRGGVGLNTAFLDITYAEYSHLAGVPTPSEIMVHILPDARVTAIKELPMTVSDALTDTARVNTLINSLNNSK